MTGWGGRALLARAWLAGAACLASTASAEGEKRIVAGAGAEVVAAQCVLCHDLSHITRSRLSRDEWEDNLAMMVKRGMPPLPAAEADAALAYLTQHYGPKGPAPDAPFFGEAMPGAPPDVEQLLVAHGCVGCHAVDKRIVGPSFREVAARHAKLADISPLVRKLRAGGVGVWGTVPMPAMPLLTPAQAEALVRHVLATK